jgi:GTPase SAR1 family protein
MSGGADHIPLLIVGASNVGKSTYTQHIRLGGAFRAEDRPESTMGVDWVLVEYDVEAVGERVKLMLMDCQGTRQNVVLRVSTVARNARIVFFVYDLTNRASFDELRSYWIPHCEAKCHLAPICVIIGNKLDDVLANPSTRAVAQEEALALGKSIGAAHCYELAAREPGGAALELVRLPVDIALTEFIEKQRAATRSEDGRAGGFNIAEIRGRRTEQKSCCS